MARPYRHPGITRVTLKIAFSSYLTRKKAISMLRVFRQAVGDNASLSWTWCALAMGFPICLSRKRPSHGLGVRSRWPLSPVCRRKSVSGLPGIPQRGPERSPKVARELPSQKTFILFLICS